MVVRVDGGRVARRRSRRATLRSASIAACRSRRPRWATCAGGRRRRSCRGRACATPPVTRRLSRRPSGRARPAPPSSAARTASTSTCGPALAPGARRPVLVWIHGGGMRRGSAVDPARDGSALAAHGLVVVSVAYRLGALGFFAHPLAERGVRARLVGSLRLLDQIAALRVDPAQHRRRSAAIRRSVTDLRSVRRRAHRPVPPGDAARARALPSRHRALERQLRRAPLSARSAARRRIGGGGRGALGARRCSTARRRCGRWRQRRRRARGATRAAGRAGGRRGRGPAAALRASGRRLGAARHHLSSVRGGQADRRAGAGRLERQRSRRHGGSPPARRRTPPVTRGASPRSTATRRRASKSSIRRATIRAPRSCAATASRPSAGTCERGRARCGTVQSPAFYYHFERAPSTPATGPDARHGAELAYVFGNLDEPKAATRRGSRALRV